MRYTFAALLTLTCAACAGPVDPTPLPSTSTTTPASATPDPTPDPTPAPTPAPTSGPLTYTVMRTDTHAPIIDAEITIDGIYQGKTNAQGQLVIAFVEYGRFYHVRVYRVFYVTFDADLTFTSSEYSTALARQ